ncbi:MAG TPA: zf-HC2 domain-containing protein, partial [Puia sp.]|nr:zf-HC2 domain-containing protein [Puia sp.]
MNCKEVQAAMIDYLDQALPAASAARIKEHLDSCSECRREVEDLQVLLTTMKAGVQEMPSPRLRENFNTMLQSELNMEAMANILQDPTSGKRPHATIVTIFSSVAGRAAAAVILLAGGIGIGMAIKSGPETNNQAEINTLKTEVAKMEVKMKEQDMLSLIDDESASQRIKAVGYAEDMANPDQQVIDALFNSLNHDKNVNVRLAALYSLARFADRHTVRDSLVSSLSTQNEPIIQVVLINLLAEKRESKAIAP